MVVFAYFCRGHSTYLQLKFCSFFNRYLQKESSGCVLLKNVLKIFAKFTEYTYNVIKKRFQHRCIPVNFAKFLRTLLVLKRLLLYLKRTRIFWMSLLIFSWVYFTSKTVETMDICSKQSHSESFHSAADNYTSWVVY